MPKSKGITASSRSVATTEGLIARAPDGKMSIPFKRIGDLEGITVGFRQDMLTLSDENGIVGEVSTGAGLGTDFILIQWKDHQIVIRGLDLLKALVKDTAPDDLERLPS